LQSPYGYGVYFYKDGYISSKLYTGNYYKGDSMGEMQTAYLTKKRTCFFPVSNLIANSDSISTTASAEISHLGKNKAPKYTPTSPDVNRHAKVDVTFEIIDKNGVVLHREIREETLIPEEKKSVSFTGPKFAEEDKARIYTKPLNEPKCMSYIISKQEKLIGDAKLQVISPVNNRKYYSSNIDLKILSNFPNHKFSLDGGNNISFTPNTTLTGLLDGTHSLIIYAYDNNIGISKYINFSIESTKLQEWEKTFGGGSSDWARSIIQTSDSGYVLAGHTLSYSVGEDAYVVKIDNNGQEMWSKTFGGVGNDAAHSIIQTSDSGYILVGKTMSSYSVGRDDVYIVKIDNNGEKMWKEIFGGVGDDGAYSIIQTSNGYVLSGYANPYGSDGNGYVVKTNNYGEIMWDKTYGGLHVEFINSIIKTSDGGYVLAGSTKSQSAGNYDVYIVKTDSYGGKIWEKKFGGIGYDEAKSIIQTSDGYVFAGYTWSSGAGGYDAYVMKIDNNGEKIWEKTFGGVSYEGANSIIQTSDGYVFAGRTSSYGAGNSDAYVVKIDNNGKEMWSKTFGGVRQEVANSIIQTSDGSYVLAGWTHSYGAGSNDAYVVKFNEYTNSNFVLPEVLDNTPQNNLENEKDEDFTVSLMNLYLMIKNIVFGVVGF
jgi:hypothetical protein